MEDAIHAAEATVGELEATLNDPNFYATRAKDAAEITAKLETARTKVARLYGRWEEVGAVGS